MGTPGGFTILEFAHEQVTYLFREKGGQVDPADARDHLPADLNAGVSWAAGKSDTVKEFAIPSEKAMEIFEQGVYVYFPSSRSEIPHWLNLESMPTTDFDFQPRFTQRLRKPIFVERALERFQRWLLSVLIELALPEPMRVFAQINLHTAGSILIDLQHRALPELIKLFPNVQFIVSSHSPLFVLGMENTLGADGIAVIDMPSGTPIQAEAYAEFGNALKVLQNTKAFAAEIEKAAAAPGKAMVLLEGETDPIYFQAAAELLGRQALLDKVEFEWVGAKDPKRGQGFNTGKDALNRAFVVLCAKPTLSQREVIFLYDQDAKKADDDRDGLHVRSLPQNAANTEIECGIENLLPESSITEHMF